MTRQVLNTFLIVRPYGLAAVHIESAVMPIQHVGDDQICDFTLSFKHFEDFIAKQLFKLTSIRRRAGHEGGIFVKAAIGGQYMQMWIKILNCLFL